MKRVPVPSIGRTVCYQERGAVYAAVVTATRGYATVQLFVLGSFAAEHWRHGITYGENQNGHWWWPPRVYETMEVEEPEAVRTPTEFSAKDARAALVEAKYLFDMPFVQPTREFTLVLALHLENALRVIAAGQGGAT